MEKAAYTAVGAPVSAVKALSARVSELREWLRHSRHELTEDFAGELENWVAEGEKVVSEALARLRATGAGDRTQAMRERVEVTVEAMGETLEVVEPEAPLELIRGIGPGFANRLRTAGITGISSLLDGTTSRQALENLAGTTGSSPEMLAQWRRQADLSQISGVGKGYQRLLHRVEVWTLDQLAEAEPSALAAEMEQIDTPDVPSVAPTEDRVRGWVEEARRVASEFDHLGDR